MPSSGTSFIAVPSTYIGKVVSYVDSSNPTEEAVLDNENIREILFKTTSLLVSNGSWTGIPKGFCRFTIACKDDDFQKALGCLQSFKKLVHGQ
jgi:methionine S-methyltransferase